MVLLRFSHSVIPTWRMLEDVRWDSAIRHDPRLILRWMWDSCGVNPYATCGYGFNKILEVSSLDKHSQEGHGSTDRIYLLLENTSRIILKLNSLLATLNIIPKPMSHVLSHFHKQNLKPQGYYIRCEGKFSITISNRSFFFNRHYSCVAQNV